MTRDELVRSWRFLRTRADPDTVGDAVLRLVGVSLLDGDALESYALRALRAARSSALRLASRKKRRPVRDEDPRRVETPFQILERRERLAATLAAVRRLPAAQQRAVLLAARGFTAAEAAEMEGVSEKAYTSRLQRARQELRG